MSVSGQVSKIQGDQQVPVEMVQVQEPGASMKRVYEGAAKLFSSALGSTVNINTDAKTLKEKGVEKLSQDLWAEVEKWVQTQGNELIQIEIRPDPDAPRARDLITISIRDAQGVPQPPITRWRIPQELLDKMEKLREAIQPNRKTSHLHPLQTSVPEALGNTLGAYIKAGHLERFRSYLPDPAKKQFLRNALTTEVFLQRAIQGLSQLREKKKKELDQVPFLPQAKRRASEQEWEQIQHLTHQFTSIGEKGSRYALFAAIGSWNNLETNKSGVTEEEIQLCAQQLTLHARNDLHAIENERKSTHYFKNSFIGRQFGLYTALEGGAYSSEMGDLLLRGPVERQKRFDETQRSSTKTTAEQFVVEIMMNLSDPTVNVDEGHPLLQHLSDENRAAIMPILKAAMTEASEAHFDLKDMAEKPSLQEQIAHIPAALKDLLH